ncbi:MAG: hypothetical protein JSS68_21295 [Actinobacteria bacterium]|nr:hypothetical protein [Actinomycetota bacterium]
MVRALILTVCVALALGVLVAPSVATAAKGHVYKVPNLAKDGYESSIPVRVVVPKGMRYVPVRRAPCYVGEAARNCGRGGWFQGRRYSTAVGRKADRVGTVTGFGYIHAWGFGWVRRYPPKCRSTWNTATVAHVHICQAYCISLATTCFYQPPAEGFSPISDQVETFWKRARGGGYLYLGVDYHVRLRKVTVPDFSDRVFSDALAIVEHSNRVR